MRCIVVLCLNIKFEVILLNTTYTDKAKIFKAFCDENRLMIICMLQDGEKCACKILEKLEISQSTLSHHMKILVESGIVTARKDYKWIHYSLSKEGINHAKNILHEITEVNCKCK